MSAARCIRARASLHRLAATVGAAQSSVQASSNGNTDRCAITALITEIRKEETKIHIDLDAKVKVSSLTGDVDTCFALWPFVASGSNNERVSVASVPAIAGNGHVGVLAC